MDDVSIMTPAEIARRKTTDELATLVTSRFEVASNARTNAGITQLMIECKRASLGQPLTGVHMDPNFPVVWDVTTPITRGLIAILRDTLTASAERLFTLEATSVPALPKEAEDRIIGILSNMQMAQMQMGLPPDDQQSHEQAIQLVNAANVEAKSQAQLAADNLKSRIKDILQDNGFSDSIYEALEDLVQSVAMVLRVPSNRLRKKKVWQNGRMSYVDEVVRTVERLNPLDVYPSPNAVNTQTCDYVIVRSVATPNELAALAAVEGYDANEIMRVFTEYKDGFKCVDGDYNVSLLREPDQSTAIVTNMTQDGLFDILCMYGRVKGDLLTEMGVEGLTPHLHYEAEVLVVGTCVIRATLNPDASGRRPIYMVSYDPVPGSVWGRCPVSHIIPYQRGATSSFVSLLGDLSLAGLHIELDASRLHDDDKFEADAIRPRIARIVKPKQTVTSGRAYDLFSVTPNTAIFAGQIDKFEEKAFSVVGLQRFAVGETTGVSSVGRTSGGLASLMNQATKGIMQILRNLESKIIEPTVQYFVDYELQWGDNPADMSGDVSVRAKGLSTVAEQAGQGEDLAWALQTLSAIADKVDPQTGQPFVPAAAFVRLVYQLFKSKNIPTTGIFPAHFESSSVLSDGQTPEQPAPDAGLDGRSQGAIDSMESTNDPMGVKP